MEIKQEVLNIARELGFQKTVIASLQPLTAERERYQQWLDRGFAGDMDYLKRNPELRTTPASLRPQSLSAIIVSVSYYSDPPEQAPAHCGQVANYAVGLDYHVVLRARLRELQSRIEKAIGRPLVGKAFTDDVPLLEQALARRHGLGFRGKNALVLGPKLMGSYNFIAELLSDLELEPDEEYQGTCGACFRCADACPTGAIVSEKNVDARLCISYLTIENKGAIPVELRKKMGSWVFGCDVCQQVCPYNQRPPQTPWKEFRPESGVGHYLDLFDLLKIRTQEEFHTRFVPTALRRPKRRGLLRNALVVLGNRKPDSGVNHILEFAQQEPDGMLREHAAWAIAQYDSAEGRKALAKLLASEVDESIGKTMRNYCG